MALLHSGTGGMMLTWSKADQPGMTEEYLRVRDEGFAQIAFKNGADHEQDGTGDCIRAGVDRTSVGTEGRD